MMTVVECLKKDREKAVRKSRMEGIEEGKVEVAKKMLGYNIALEIISKATGISVKELKKIK